ncbi:MAG TPA: hypothetical protein VFC04_00745 [Actinomycetota bacterium]|nr:hypothetical protein [Actinomycetota bacterium]
MSAVALVLVLVWARIPKESVGPAGEGRPPERLVDPGRLVYAAEELGRPGHEVLWTLDLATGEASPGPEVPTVSRIVDATAAGPGWVGLTVSTRHGERAYVLRGLTAADRPTPIATGDLVAWDPQGAEVAVAHSGTRRRGCRRPAEIDLVSVRTSRQERVFEQSHPCGRLLSIGLDGQLTYFTSASHGRVGIYYVGVDVAHRVLFGYGMLAVSPASDFLVTPLGTGDPRALALASRRAVLYWRGDGGPVPLGTGRRDLHIDRTLAWSPDASEAIVAGRLGGSRGVYVVDVGPGLTERSPRLIVAAGKRAGAAFAPDGTAYLAIGGGLFASSGPGLASATGSGVPGATGLVSVRLPDGAPRPAGPIAWIP